MTDDIDTPEKTQTNQTLHTSWTAQPDAHTKANLLDELEAIRVSLAAPQEGLPQEGLSLEGLYEPDNLDDIPLLLDRVTESDLSDTPALDESNNTDNNIKHHIDKHIEQGGEQRQSMPENTTTPSERESLYQSFSEQSFSDSYTLSEPMSDYDIAEWTYGINLSEYTATTPTKNPSATADTTERTTNETLDTENAEEALKHEAPTPLTNTPFAGQISSNDEPHERQHEIDTPGELSPTEPHTELHTELPTGEPLTEEEQIAEANLQLIDALLAQFMPQIELELRSRIEQQLAMLNEEDYSDSTT